MSEGAQTSLLVSVQNTAACVRVIGQAKFTSATDFKNLLLQLEKDGCTDIVLDLTRCTIMDSTFLGMMTSAAKRCEAARAQGQRRKLALFNPTERVLESLENLDVLRVFDVVKDAPECGAFQRVSDGKTNRSELTRTCYEAHEALRQTNPENDRRFRDAAEFFRQKLQDGDGK